MFATFALVQCLRHHFGPFKISRKRKKFALCRPHFSLLGVFRGVFRGGLLLPIHACSSGADGCFQSDVVPSSYQPNHQTVRGGVTEGCPCTIDTHYSPPATHNPPPTPPTIHPHPDSAGGSNRRVPVHHLHRPATSTVLLVRSHLFLRIAVFTPCRVFLIGC